MLPNNQDIQAIYNPGSKVFTFLTYQVCWQSASFVNLLCPFTQPTCCNRE